MSGVKAKLIARLRRAANEEKLVAELTELDRVAAKEAARQAAAYEAEKRWVPP